MNVLISCASRKVSLVRAFQTALSRTGGGDVMAVDIDPMSAALYVADRSAIVPRSDHPDFVSQLVELCRRNEIGLIIPTRDEELPVFSAATSAFEAVGATVVVSAPDVVALCQDKLAFQAFCDDHGFDTPERFVAPSSVQFPAFVRPRHGKGSVGATMVRSRAELTVATESIGGDALIQDYIEAPEFSIDMLADFDGRLVSAVPRQRVQIVAGESYVSRVTLDTRLLDTAHRLAATIRFIGHVTVQCFLTADRVPLIEVNPRFGGAAALGWAAGAVTPEVLVRLAQGQRVHVDPSTIQDGLVMLRYTDDVMIPGGRLMVRVG